MILSLLITAITILNFITAYLIYNSIIKPIKRYLLIIKRNNVKF